MSITDFWSQYETPLLWIAGAILFLAFALAIFKIGRAVVYWYRKNYW